MWTRTFGARGALAALALAMAGPAAAAPGNGIRLGGTQGRIHPSLELEARWDSNVYYTSQRQAAADLVLQIRPGFELSAPGELVSVDLAANLEWAQYLGIDDPESKDLSKLYGGATLGVQVNPRGTIGLEIDDEFRRTPSTSSLLLGSAVIANYNSLRLRAPWKPGGGALVFSLVGDWTLETYEPFFDGQLCLGNPTACDSAVLDDLGYNDVSAGGEVKWRFLPRTSATFEAGWFSRMPADTTRSKEVSGVEVQAGVQGLVTPHVSATVKLGYADTLGSADEDFRTWLATLEGQWIASESIAVRAGYGHGWGIDPGLLDDLAGQQVAALFTRSQLWAGGKLILAGRFAARADVTWERRSYSLVTASATASLLRIEPSLEASVTRWMTASVGYAYTDRTSDFPPAMSTVPAFSYSKSEAWLRLFFRY